MIVFGVRHALYSTKGGALTQLGNLQAEQVGLFLAQATAGKRVRVISSPLLRAKQTAEAVAAACGAELQVLIWLDEREFSYPVFERYVTYAEGLNEFEVLLVVHHEANVKLVATMRTLHRFEDEVLPGSVVELDWAAPAARLVFAPSRPSSQPASA